MIPAAGAPRRAGVIGGMGPEATLVFVEKFYALSRARREQARPPLLVDIDPTVPDRNRAWRNGDDAPARALVRMGRRLKNAGADFCVMPCVTAHGFAGGFEGAAGLPLLHLPEVVRDALAADARTPLGLLATTTTLEMGLFRDAFAERSPPPLVPEPAAQEELMRAIYAVKQGRSAEARARVRDVAEALAAGGARTILVACTDLSAIAPDSGAECAVVDALDLLARRTLAEIETARD